MRWSDVLTALVAGRDLEEETAAGAMRSIMSGDATPSQIGAFLVALRAKGETVDEITGLARVMRELSVRVEAAGPLVDTCGTGGDRAGTVNISTMAAIVAAGAGARVAKHGNRAASSTCGSADLLEALGVALELKPDAVAACIDEAGIGFMFAPAFHPAMRHAAPVRRELGLPTVFNVLGPLTNPAGATRQTVGVGDAVMAPKLAKALLRLGTERAMVFRGEDGLDELSTTGPSTIWSVSGSVTSDTFDPSSLGIARASPSQLTGGTAEQNAAVARAVLDGDEGAVADAVCLAAAAALVVAQIAPDLADGLERARASIASHAARHALDALVATSQKYAG